MASLSEKIGFLWLFRFIGRQRRVEAIAVKVCIISSSTDFILDGLVDCLGNIRLGNSLLFCCFLWFYRSQHAGSFRFGGDKKVMAQVTSSVIFFSPDPGVLAATCPLGETRSAFSHLVKAPPANDRSELKRTVAQQQIITGQGFGRAIRFGRDLPVA